MSPLDDARLQADAAPGQNAFSGGMVGAGIGGAAGLGIQWWRREKEIQKLMEQGYTREQAEERAPSRVAGALAGAAVGGVGGGMMGYHGTDQGQSLLDALAATGKEGYKGLSTHKFDTQKELDDAMSGFDWDAIKANEAGYENPDARSELGLGPLTPLVEAVTEDDDKKKSLFKT